MSLIAELVALSLKLEQTGKQAKRAAPAGLGTSVEPESWRPRG